MLGDPRVGKTEFMHTWADGRPPDNPPFTIPPDFKMKRCRVRAVGSEGLASYNLRLQLWDTSGMDRFRHVSRAYFRHAHGLLLMFDVCDRRTFDSIRETWLPQIQQNATESVRVLLVGMKADDDDERLALRREVSVAEGEELAALLTSTIAGNSCLHGAVGFTECSARGARAREQTERVVYELTRELCVAIKAGKLRPIKPPVSRPPEHRPVPLALRWRASCQRVATWMCGTR